MRAAKEVEDHNYALYGEMINTICALTQINMFLHVEGQAHIH
ncbi:Type I restriction-modification system, M subunit [Rickettsia canadensis str. CA410]|uniref:Type I restriction-modification system, M subunit n=1 Tax=Rickettsia canadensis str. CA410 TaxID=1105107 RepID=A0ABM5MR77_RICCA|nr:Type I restriction-modification system, M subunit [Rickettsia canadensis str. CA410]